MTESRRERSRRPSLGTILWILVLVIAGYRLWPQISAAAGVGGVDSPAPALEAVTLEGDTVALDELRGRVVLVNFWATWCGPCRWEMPGFQDVYEARREEGFTIIGLSTDVGAPDLVRAFVRDHGITYPIAAATSEMKRAFGGVPALPMSFLIDRDGIIRHRVMGIFAEPALARAVDRLLAEADGGE
ncbi:MAG: peroxiredoxin family protein, partial [Gemmatimonadota bacterium]